MESLHFTKGYITKFCSFFNKILVENNPPAKNCTIMSVQFDQYSQNELSCVASTQIKKKNVAITSPSKCNYNPVCWHFTLVFFCFLTLYKMHFSLCIVYIFSFVSGFCLSIIGSRDSYRLFYIAIICLFWWWYSLPLYEYTTIWFWVMKSEVVISV